MRSTSRCDRVATEPQVASAQTEPSRFVILRHDWPQLHWDFMLQTPSGLWTWRLAQAPPAGGGLIPARRLPDHRVEYLDYEGPVSGHRGTVIRDSSGTFDPLPADAGTVRVRLTGRLVDGSTSKWDVEISNASEDIGTARFTPIR